MSKGNKRITLAAASVLKSKITLAYKIDLTCWTYFADIVGMSTTVVPDI